MLHNGRVERIASDLKMMSAVVLALSAALPLVMYQSAKWHREADSYADRLDHAASMKTASAEAAEHINNWSEAKKRMPLADISVAENSDKPTQMGVNIDNQHMSRVEVDHVLEGLAQNTDGMFIPDAFLVRTAKAGDGIFTKNAAEDFPASLALTIKGEFISRDIQ